MVLLVGCWPKSIPTDAQLELTVTSYEKLLLEYVELLRENKNLYEIRLSTLKQRSASDAGNGINLLYSREKARDDFVKKLKVDLITPTSFRRGSDSEINEIRFYSYRSGFAKGISHILEHEDLFLVNDLSLYGTKKDPRKDADGQPRTVHKKVKGNWFLFAM